MTCQAAGARRAAAHPRPARDKCSAQLRQHHVRVGHEHGHAAPGSGPLQQAADGVQREGLGRRCLPVAQALGARGQNEVCCARICDCLQPAHSLRCPRPLPGGLAGLLSAAAVTLDGAPGSCGAWVSWYARPPLTAASTPRASSGRSQHSPHLQIQARQGDPAPLAPGQVEAPASQALPEGALPVLQRSVRHLARGHRPCQVSPPEAHPHELGHGGVAACTRGARLGACMRGMQAAAGPAACARRELLLRISVFSPASASALTASTAPAYGTLPVCSTPNWSSRQPCARERGRRLPACAAWPCGQDQGVPCTWRRSR